MSEKVLFELRIHTDEDGTRIEVHESAEWQAYHGTGHGPGPDTGSDTDRGPDHRARRVGRDGDGLFAWATRFCCPDDESADSQSEPRKRPTRADNLRWALSSLQNIYDDLYGDASA